MATTRSITDAELLRLPKDGQKYELVDGELRAMSPAGWKHEITVVRLAARLVAFVEPRRLGDVLGSNALYMMLSGNRRGPDLSFIGAGRLSSDCPPFPRLAPDLAVEILSPDDRPREVLDKVGEYLQSGVRLVWVIDPAGRKAVVHRSLSDVREIEEDDALDGEDVIPGFRCSLADIL
jgi:Uma2 family endonuclease